MKKLLFIISFICLKTYAQPADLSKGQWIKVAIKESGIYKIDKAFLDKYAPEFARVSPDMLRIYTGYPYVLPQANNQGVTSELTEVPVMHNSNNSKWLKDDQIIFFASGPDKVFYENNQWKHQLHPYSQHNYYYITIGSTSSKKTETLEKSVNLKTQDYLPYLQYEDHEKTNLLQSGRLWVGDFFNSNLTIKTSPDGFVSDFKLNLELLPSGRINQILSVSSANTILIRDTLKGSTYNSNDNLARYNRISNIYHYQIDRPDPVSEIELSLNSESIGTPGAYFNYWSVSYNRLIQYKSGQTIRFIVPKNYTDTNFQITHLNNNTKIWQILNPFDVVALQPDNNGIFSIKPVESAIMLFDQQSLKTPQVETFKNHIKPFLDLFPEMLVVFPENFRAQADRLIQYKRENEGLEITGYSTTEIYDHYSSGKTDPSAIRNLCKELYDASNGKLKFLLLLGDATYDYKNINNARYIKPELMVPAYQSRESLEPVYSYSSDDYFGFMGDQMGEWPEGFSQNNHWVSTSDQAHLLDIAVGRIPAKNAGELNNYINKYIKYIESIASQSWQNKIAFVADNRDFNTHQRDSESLETILLNSNPGIITEKLYLDDFPVEKVETGYISPLAKEKLSSLIDKGTYFIAYNGHGAENGLTDEKLLTLSDIINSHNAATLPIWLTATCAFGRFDNPGTVSAGELSLLHPTGGAIALLTTTRAVFSNTNLKLNQALFENIGNAKTLGELFVLTKNQSIQGEVNRNFTLLGDPSLPLPYWYANAEIDISRDTLYATEKISFTGLSPEVENGELILTIIDKPTAKTTLGSFPDGPPFNYQSRSNIVFQGVYSIHNHRFSGDFALPVQQAPGVGEGRVILSTKDNNSQQIYYSSKSAILSSQINSESETGASYPQLSASISEGYLIWKISDKTGINLSGFYPDAELLLTINNQVISNALDYYQSLDDGKTGEIIFPIENLKNGVHSTSLFVSNIYNINRTETFSFEIKKPDLKILETKIFPNPVNDYLNLSINHNRKGDNLNYKLLFYNSMGNLIGEVENKCNKCPETLLLTPDLGLLNRSLSSVFFNLIIKSETDNQKDHSSGSLFFWK